MFVYESKAAWPAKQCVGVGDDKISVELWWTSYLFIQVVLWWSAHPCGTTGVSCGHIGQEGHLSETCHYATVTQICSSAKLVFCRIDVEMHCVRRLKKGIGKLWGDGEKSL